MVYTLREKECLKYASSLKVLNALNKLWLSKKLCDVLLIAQDFHLFVHKIILIAHCPYFRADLIDTTPKDLVQIELRKSSKEGLICILNYLYGSELEISEHNYADILVTATEMKIEFLIEACESFMKAFLKDFKDEMKNSDTTRYEAIDKFHSLVKAMETLKHAKLSCSYEIIVEFIAQHFDMFMQTKTFGHLNARHLSSILKNGNLRVLKEIELFNSILRWIRKEKSREKYAECFFDCVRFDLIAPGDLDTQVEHVDIVMKNPKFKQKIKKVYENYALKKANVEWYVDEDYKKQKRNNVEEKRHNDGRGLSANKMKKNKTNDAAKSERIKLSDVELQNEGNAEKNIDVNEKLRKLKKKISEKENKIKEKVVKEKNINKVVDDDVNLEDVSSLFGDENNEIEIKNNNNKGQLNNIDEIKEVKKFKKDISINQKDDKKKKEKKVKDRKRNEVVENQDFEVSSLFADEETPDKNFEVEIKNDNDDLLNKLKEIKKVKETKVNKLPNFEVIEESQNDIEVNIKDDDSISFFEKDISQFNVNIEENYENESNIDNNILVSNASTESGNSQNSLRESIILDEDMIISLADKASEDIYNDTDEQNFNYNFNKRDKIGGYNLNDEVKIEDNSSCNKTNKVNVDSDISIEINATNEINSISQTDSFEVTKEEENLRNSFESDDNLSQKTDDSNIEDIQQIEPFTNYEFLNKIKIKEETNEFDTKIDNRVNNDFSTEINENGSVEKQNEINEFNFFLIQNNDANSDLDIHKKDENQNGDSVLSEKENDLENPIEITEENINNDLVETNDKDSMISITNKVSDMSIKFSDAASKVKNTISNNSYFKRFSGVIDNITGKNKTEAKLDDLNISGGSEIHPENPSEEVKEDDNASIKSRVSAKVSEAGGRITDAASVMKSLVSKNNYLFKFKSFFGKNKDEKNKNNEATLDDLDISRGSEINQGESVEANDVTIPNEPVDNSDSISIASKASAKVAEVSNKLSGAASVMKNSVSNNFDKMKNMFVSKKDKNVLNADVENENDSVNSVEATVENSDNLSMTSKASAKVAEVSTRLSDAAYVMKNSVSNNFDKMKDMFGRKKGQTDSAQINEDKNSTENVDNNDIQSAKSNASNRMSEVSSKLSDTASIVKNKFGKGLKGVTDMLANHKAEKNKTNSQIKEPEKLKIVSEKPSESVIITENSDKKPDKLETRADNNKDIKSTNNEEIKIPEKPTSDSIRSSAEDENTLNKDKKVNKKDTKGGKNKRKNQTDLVDNNKDNSKKNNPSSDNNKDKNNIDPKNISKDQPGKKDELLIPVKNDAEQNKNSGQDSKKSVKKDDKDTISELAQNESTKKPSKKDKKDKKRNSKVLNMNFTDELGGLFDKITKKDKKDVKGTTQDDELKAKEKAAKEAQKKAEKTAKDDQEAKEREEKKKQDEEKRAKEKAEKDAKEKVENKKQDDERKAMEKTENDAKKEKETKEKAEKKKQDDGRKFKENVENDLKKDKKARDKAEKKKQDDERKAKEKAENDAKKEKEAIEKAEKKKQNDERKVKEKAENDAKKENEAKEKAEKKKQDDERKAKEKVEEAKKAKEKAEKAKADKKKDSISRKSDSSNKKSDNDNKKKKK